MLLCSIGVAWTYLMQWANNNNKPLWCTYLLSWWFSTTLNTSIYTPLWTLFFHNFIHRVSLIWLCLECNLKTSKHPFSGGAFQFDLYIGSCACGKHTRLWSVQCIAVKSSFIGQWCTKTMWLLYTRAPWPSTRRGGIPFSISGYTKVFLGYFWCQDFVPSLSAPYKCNVSMLVSKVPSGLAYVSKRKCIEGQ